MLEAEDTDPSDKGQAEPPRLVRAHPWPKILILLILFFLALSICLGLDLIK